MRKEVLVAIFIGVTLGLIMTYGIYVARNSLMNQSDSNQAPSPFPSPSSFVESTLVISSPADESLVSDKSITLTGTTVPQSNVVISTIDQDIATTADGTGHFSVALTLKPGGNILVVTAIDPAGQKTVSERSVVLAVDEFLSIEDSTPSAQVSPSPKVATSSSKVKASPSPTTNR